MKITIVGPVFPYKGGIATHTNDLAHRLSRRGDEVRVESWKRQYPRALYPGVQYLDEPENEPFPFTRYPLSWNRPDTWRSLGRRAGQHSDLVVLVLVSPIQFPAYEMLTRAAKRAGARVVAIAHNVVPHENRRADRLLTLRLLRHLDALLVHSESERCLAIGLGARSIEVAGLPCFFNLDGFSPRTESSPTDRLAFVGFVRPYKGLDVLLEAMHQAQATPRLTVHGEFWQDVDDYRALAQRLGIAVRCEFVDEYASFADMVTTIDGADALVLPYRSATGTQMPRLARARGVPSIVTDVGDMASQIRDGLDGFVVAPSDPDQLARAIDRLYADETLDSLKNTVAPVDIDTEWDAYLAALDRCATPTP